MSRALIQVAAAAALLVLLWRSFRLAMGLRAARVHREEQRRAEEAKGRRVVAEIASRDGDMFLFLEAADAFTWRDRRVEKADVVGCRLLLNGAMMAQTALPGAALPEPTPPEEMEGRERWDVRLYVRDGPSSDVPCGTLREGVSRDAARAVYEAAAAVLRSTPST
jgi:hypothetical protein